MEIVSDLEVTKGANTTRQGPPQQTGGLIHGCAARRVDHEVMVATLYGLYPCYVSYMLMVVRLRLSQDNLWRVGGALSADPTTISDELSFWTSNCCLFSFACVND